MDIIILDRILPATGLRSDEVAVLEGNTGARMTLALPPAGWRHPAVGLREALAFALCETRRVEASDAWMAAADAAPGILRGYPPLRRPRLLGLADYFGAAPACVSIEDAAEAMVLIAGPGAQASADWLLACAKETAHTPLVYTRGRLEPGCTIHDLPDDPLPAALNVFWPGLDWVLRSEWPAIPNTVWPEFEMDAGYRDWLIRFRPEIEALGGAVGHPVFHYPENFEDVYALDDPEGHRLLALDYLCHSAPSSPFVRFLVEATGAPTLAALREAVRSPSAYGADFQLAGFGGLNVETSRALTFRRGAES